jgi:hypothetical protein
MKKLLFTSALHWIAFILLASISAAAQTPSTVTTPTAPAPVAILKFKVGTDYYPMLDRQSSPMSADNGDFPRLATEQQMGRTGRRGDTAMRVDENRARGRLHTNIKIISDAQWVNVTIKNTGAQAIKAIAWDFAFLRHEAGRPAFRYDVMSQVEIKPGGKKTLKQPLPPGAKHCQAIIVNTANGQDGAAQIFEAVCGPGFMMPSQMGQETVAIKRIEYADGSVWQR